MIQVQVQANSSPLSGTEGTKLPSQLIKEYLNLESENDVALRFESVDNTLILKGRGDLHLGVLLERMRREGFELLVSPPEVVTREGKGGLEEPYERVSIEASPEVMKLIKVCKFDYR